MVKFNKDSVEGIKSYDMACEALKATKPDIFINFNLRSGSDRTFATALAEELQGKGLKIFSEAVTLLPGQDRTLELPHAAETCSHMINIASPDMQSEGKHRGFYKIAKENKLFVYGDYKPVNVAKEANIAYPHLGKTDLEKAVRRANFEFFLTPRFILKNVRRLGSLDSLKAMFRKLF